MAKQFKYSVVTILFTSLLYTGNLAAQTQSSTTQKIYYPPRNSIETNIILQDSLVNIFITKEYKVKVDNEEMIFWDEIISTVMKKNREWGLIYTLLPNVIIHSDADVDYNFVDRVKEEVSRSNKKIFYYRVGNRKTGYELSSISGTVRDLWVDERIKQFNGNSLNSFSITSINNPLPSDPAYSQLIYEVDKFKKDLYQLKTDKIESFISTHKVLVLTLYPNGKILTNETLIEVEELQHLFEYVEEEVVLVFFDNGLKYFDYIKFLQRLEEIEMNEKNISFNRNFVVEISKSLEQKLLDVDFILK